MRLLLCGCVLSFLLAPLLYNSRAKRAANLRRNGDCRSGAKRQLPSFPSFFTRRAKKVPWRENLGALDTDPETVANFFLSESCIFSLQSAFYPTFLLLLPCTLSTSLAKEGSLNFGPFVWVSAGAADAAAAAACRVSAAAAAPQAEREPRRLSFIGTRGRERGT